MGFLGYLASTLFGRKARQYEAAGEFWSTQTLTRDILKGSRRAIRYDKKRKRDFSDIKSDADIAKNNPEKRQEALKALDKEITRFTKDTKAEIQEMAKILLGTESILYQMKTKMIKTLNNELTVMARKGFPKSLGKELKHKLTVFENQLEDDLQKIRSWAKREYAGSFQMATVAIRTEVWVEREVRKDAKRLRRLSRDFTRTLKRLHGDELKGAAKKADDDFKRLVMDLIKELKLCMDIAKDDFIVMHKIKEPIRDMAGLIQNSGASPELLAKWNTQLNDLYKFEEKTLADMRAATKRESREGRT